MNKQNEARPSMQPGPVDHGEPGDPPQTRTRRGFLADVGTKAAYVTPVLLTLTASPAMASAAIPSWCEGPGSPCTQNDQCCSGSCGGTTPGECD